MIEGLIGLIVVVLVLALAFWSVSQLAGAFGIPAPIVTVLHVVFVVIFVLVVVRWLGGFDNAVFR